MSRFRTYLLLIALVFIWGLSWPIAKIGLQYMPPLWFATSRLIIGTVVMILIVSVIGKLVWPRKQDLKLILVIGLLQIATFMTLINLGLYYVAAGRTAILVYTTPIWIVPASIFLFNEKSTHAKWLGFSLGIIGILIMVNPFEMHWSNHKMLLGYGILLLAALNWAIAILCARHMKWTRTPLELISWQLLVGTLPVLCLTLLKQPHPHITWNHSLVLTLLYNGILATAFAYWGTITISKELPPITTSLSLLTVPVFGLIFSAIFLHEPITLSLIIAMLFILGGLLCTISYKKSGKTAGVEKAPV